MEYVSGLKRRLSLLTAALVATVVSSTVAYGGVICDFCAPLGSPTSLWVINVLTKSAGDLGNGGTLADNFGYGTVDIASAVNVFASSTEINNNCCAPGITAVGRLNYQVEVVGPAGPLVPILIYFDLRADWMNPGSSSNATAAGARIGISGAIDDAYLLCVGNYCPGSAIASGAGTARSPSGPLSAKATPGQVINVGLEADVFVPHNVLGTAKATADPLFIIDPSFADAALYSIAVSPGFVQDSPALPDSPVPEPPSLAIYGMGIVLASFARRLKRKARE